MTVRDQLLRLVELQKILLDSGAATKIVEDAPHRIEEIEARFRERNAEFVAVKERYEALDADQRLRSGELSTLEDSRKKFMDDLMQVQNQREYSAMLREIDSVKAHISENEEAILKDMEEIEAVKGDLQSREEHIQEERKLVEKESAEVLGEADAARERIAELEKQRAKIEAALPVPLVAAVKRLELGRQGIFLARALDGVCQSCFVRVRPQAFQEVKLAAKVHACSNCKRLLYHEGSLIPAEGAGGSPSGKSDELNTVNGGAI